MMQGASGAPQRYTELGCTTEMSNVHNVMDVAWPPCAIRSTSKQGKSGHVKAAKLLCVSSAKANTSKKDCNASATNPGVHLQTFRSWVQGDLDSRCVREIVNGGSQKAFIKKELATKLHLKVLRHAKKMINAFASNNLTTVDESKVVQVHMWS